MIPRVLEPEVMEPPEEAAEYDAMDHSEVNRVFVEDMPIVMHSALWEVRPPTFLDVGTGTALIPIELCRRDEFDGRVVGVDLADEMLALARRNVESAGLSERIQVERVDAKSLPYESRSFDAVMSNSIVHHIPEPAGVLAEMVRVLRPGRLLFVRDLLRPPSQSEVEHLVATYAGTEKPRAQQLFRQSLQAALTAAEMRELVSGLGLDHVSIEQTSDRHWTVVAVR